MNDNSDARTIGRPPIEVDEDQLSKLTRLHLSDKVIADILEVSVATLHRRYADKMDRWRSEAKGKIAEVLFDEGVNNREPWALKALAQKHLDYSDKVSSENVNTNQTSLSIEEMRTKAKELAKEILGDDGTNQGSGTNSDPL